MDKSIANSLAFKVSNNDLFSRRLNIRESL